MLVASHGADVDKPVEDHQVNPGPSGLQLGLKLVELGKGDLTFKDCVGSGSFGDCYQGLYRGNIPVVIKVFKQAIVDEVIHKALAIQEIQKIEHHTCHC